MRNFEESFGQWVIRYRWPLILVTLLVLVASASGLKRIGLSNDYRYFFTEENPQLVAFEALQDTYTKDDSVLFVLAPKDGNVFTSETLAVVEELTKASWQMPYSLRVNSISNFQNTWADGDDLVVEDLVVGARSLDSSQIERIRKIALNEPLLVNRIISRSGHVTGVNVTINLPGKSVNEVPEVAAYARIMAEDIRNKYPDIDIYLTGMVMLDNAFPEASQSDMETIIPAMFLIIIVIMGVLLRSFFGTLITLLVIVFSALSAMGLAGWTGIQLTAPSMAAPTIIFTLAVADSIHILVAMFQGMRRGLARHEAIVESLRINLQPIFLTSVTTAIGFLSMNFSEVQPIRDLGNIVAMGVAGAFVYSIFFLPAVISFMPVRVKVRSKTKKYMMERLGDFVVARRRMLFWVMMIFIIVLGLGSSRIVLNDQFVDYFDERYTFRTDADFVNENLTGIYSIEYSLSAAEEGGVSSPEYLEKVEEFAQWYRGQSGVLHVNTITDIMKRLNRNMHGDDDAFYSIPDTRELSAQYLLLYELSLPYGLDLNNKINVSKTSTRFTVTLQNMSTKEMLELEEKAQAWLSLNAPKGMSVDGASTTIMFAHLTLRAIKSMLTGTTLALVLISGILLLALRSLKIGLVSLIPNIAPAFMAFGLWGYFYSEVGFGLSVVSALSMGVVVDDTIHFLSKYIRARREHGLEAPEAVRYAFRTVGTAIWVTSLILVAGFMVLTYSGFKFNSEMGLLTAVALGCALLADFLFLPPLLMKIEEGKK